MNFKPSLEEKKNFKKVTTAFLKKIKLKGAILGGSGAKDTWLSGGHDVDIFVRFDYKKYKDKSDKISDLLHKVLKKSFPKVKRLHGSRDYFQINYEGFDFEIVPIIKISKAEKALNITDISPLHAIWVNKRVKKKEEVLLIKQFCKAQRIYGAESHITGFSGYVLEILIGHYKTFEKLLKASLKWKTKEVIDPEKHYPKKDALFHLNKSKQLSPLIIIDPVDSSRNAAAALSEEKFNLFRKRAKEYLKSKSERFFVKKEIDLSKFNLVFEVTPKSGKRDVVGVKLLKCFGHISKKLEPFGVKKSAWDWIVQSRAVMCFDLKKKKLEDYELRKGPPLKLKEFVKDFKKKNKKTFVKSNRVWAKVKVKHPKLDNFVKNLLKDKYVKEKVRKIERRRP